MYRSTIARSLAVSTLVSSMLVLPLTGYAAEFLSGEIIEPTDVSTEDVYAAGSRITLSHAIESDAFAAGETINVSGAIKGDLAAAGSDVTVSGSIADDLFVAGNTVTIRAPHLDDLFAAGSRVTLDSATTVNGDVFVAGESIELAGIIKGSVRATGNQVTIAEGTTIAGDLLTYGKHEPTIGQNVTVTGNRRHTTTTDHEPRNNALLSWVRGVITWAIVALLLLYLLPTFTGTTLTTLRTRTLVSLGWGTLWLAAVIPATIFLLITIIGIPVAVALVLTTIVAVLVAMGISTLATGNWILQRVSSSTGQRLNWQHAIIGAVILQTLKLIPIVGGLLCVLLVLVSCGALVQAMIKHLRTDPAISTTPAHVDPS